MFAEEGCSIQNCGKSQEKRGWPKWLKNEQNTLNFAEERLDYFVNSSREAIVFVGPAAPFFTRLPIIWPYGISPTASNGIESEYVAELERYMTPDTATSN